MANRELTPTEVGLNKAAQGVLGLIVFLLAFCLPILAPLIFRIFSRAIGGNPFLLRCAKAGAGSFLVCLVAFFVWFMYLVYSSGNMF